MSSGRRLSAAPVAAAAGCVLAVSAPLFAVAPAEAPRQPARAANTATPRTGAQPGAFAESAGSLLTVGGVIGAAGAALAVRAGDARRSTARNSVRTVGLAAEAKVAGALCGRHAEQAQARGTCITLRAKKSVEDLSEAELKGKKVLIRCDLNVPLSSDLQITDETRITASIPTIKYLCDKGAKVIACSHLGRPKDGSEEKFSLKPVAKRMGELMGKDIKCAPDCKATDAVKELVSAMAEGDVLILENTRFYKGETKNDPELAESMASLADLFVNDAFGTAHRAHSSTEGVTNFLKPCVSGYLLKKELDYLKGAVDSPKKPMAAIVGGAKVSTKIPVIESMLDKVDKLIIGGGMVFTFLKARGLSVGKSLVEEDFLELAKKLEEKAKAKGVELILPKDVACGDAFPGDGKEVGFKVVPADSIPDDWLGLDNGPAATQEIKSALADCQTIIWNGPMGVFESSQFAKGTYDIAECLAELTEKKGATTIIGGGDSVAAVNKSGLASKMSHISTGGGASLELLEGKVLPGVAALDEAAAAPAPATAPAAEAAPAAASAPGFDWRGQTGVTEPLGFWDPAGFSAGKGEQTFKEYRSAELKHGRVAMMAALGAVVQHFVTFPGFEDVPRGIGAPFSFIGGLGFIGLLGFSYVLETDVWQQDPDKEVGDFGDPLGFGQYTEEMRNKEINNGRFAMFAIMGIILAENETGKDAIEQLFGV